MVGDTVIKEEFTGFVSQRNGVVLDNPDKETYGFLVRKDFGDDLIMSRVSSIEIITLNSEFLLDRVFPANIPCLIASLDMELANLDFWNDKEIVHDRDQYPAIQCFLMNYDLKKMFLKTFYIAEKEIDIICPCFFMQRQTRKYIPRINIG